MVEHPVQLAGPVVGWGAPQRPLEVQHGEAVFLCGASGAGKTTLLYDAGAIDDRPTTRRGDVPSAQNYVREALQSVAAGQPVKTPHTRAYGCTVKYQS